MPRTPTIELEQSLEVYRERAKTDSMYLAVDILGYDFQSNPHIGLFNEFLAKKPGTPLFDLDLKTKKRLILWPRGTFKTTAVVVEIIQLILNYPDIRILILSGSEKLAKKILAEVKVRFENPNSKFRGLFPEFCSRKSKKLGTTKEFTVPNRVKTHLREATVSISTAKSVKAGSHFDVEFIDDLVNDQNYKSPQLLENCVEDYKALGPLLDPGGFVYVTGTVYSYLDCYQFIQDGAKEEMKRKGASIWKFSIRTCWVELCAHCGAPDALHDADRSYKHPKCPTGDTTFLGSGERKVLFPQVRTQDGRTIGHTVEFLQQQKAEYGDEFFAAQYENRIIPSGTQTFTPELLNQQSLYHLAQIPQSGPVFIVGDLSYVGDDKRDQTVFLTTRIHDGQLFVFDCLAGKWGTQDVTENLIRLTMIHRPRVIWLERFLGWEAYDTFFKSYAIQKQIQQLPIEWVQMSNVEGAKTRRIGTIQTVLSQKRLWLFAGMPNYDTLCEQLKRFPKLGRHDDHADCLGHVVSVPSGYHLSAVPEAKPLPDYIQNTFLEKKVEIDPESPLSFGLIG